MLKLIAPTAILALSLALTGCGIEDELDAQIQAQDMAKCNSRGFANGTEAMATCMATLSNEREAEWARSEARRKADEAKKKAQQRTDISSVPASTRPTAESAGVDPATANMSMCSDGALREDCADAPLGY